MSSSIPSPALSFSHSSNLLEILRRANAHYSRIAAAIRVSVHPTHRARKRATALKLTISIQKALKLDSKQISTIPLPVIDQVISPPPIDLSTVEGELSRTSRPLLKCTIPSSSTLSTPASVYSCVPLRPQTTQQDLTSRWSISPIEIDSDLPEGIAVTCNTDYDQDTFLCDSTNHLDVPPLNSMRPLSWASDISDFGSLNSRSVTSVKLYLTEFWHHFTQIASRQTDADGLEKLTIRIKRKSSEMNDDTLEKRPKVCISILLSWSYLTWSYLTCMRLETISTTEQGGQFHRGELFREQSLCATADSSLLYYRTFPFNLLSVQVPDIPHSIRCSLNNN